LPPERSKVPGKFGARKVEAVLGFTSEGLPFADFPKREKFGFLDLGVFIRLG
jgi:hypothetical protein